MSSKKKLRKIFEPLFQAISESSPLPELTITDEQVTTIQNLVAERQEKLYNYVFGSRDQLLMSRFSLPAPKSIKNTDAQFSLWVGDFDFSNLPDDYYEITAIVKDATGNVLDELGAKPIIVDRNTVATTLSVDEGENTATYTYEDGTGREVIVATVSDPEERAILNLTAEGILPDYFGVGFQIREYLSGEVWNPVITRGECSSLIDPNTLAGIGITEDYEYNILNSVPFILAPEDASSISVEMLLNPYYSSDASKQYWLNSIAIDNAMNMGTTNVPIRLDVVPREADRAIVSSDTDTIYQDTEKITLTVGFSKRTVHSVGVVVQYKVIGEAEWTQINEAISLALR